LLLAPAPGDYGVFVLDPDGHNIEAVCHTSQWVLSYITQVGELAGWRQLSCHSSIVELIHLRA
jgi:hypothetical protein